MSTALRPDTSQSRLGIVSDRCFSYTIHDRDPELGQCNAPEYNNHDKVANLRMQDDKYSLRLGSVEIRILHVHQNHG